MIKITEKELEPLSKEDVCPYCGAKLVLEDSVCSYCKTSEEEIKKIHKMKEALEREEDIVRKKDEQIKKLIEELEILRLGKRKKEERRKEKIEKFKKIQYFTKRHTELCNCVLNTYNKLCEAEDSLTLTNLPESDKEKYRERISQLEKDFLEAKRNLLEQKERYKTDKDLRRPLRGLSKIQSFLKDDWRDNK